MLTGKARMILEALEPHARTHNMEIVTVELVGSRKAPTIRVFLDCEGGVGFVNFLRHKNGLMQSWMS